MSETTSHVKPAELGDDIQTLLAGDTELMSLPRATVWRSLLLNHWYHHRGQLSVYLRMLDVPIPSIYGPSGDENPFSRGEA